ncbi:MAG TPA: hypothetical protein VEL31_30740 [Ktedonobacteraceae bacterium]|nr:hypothetical protein [Ktedonobacteraceae bacterium]
MNNQLIHKLEERLLPLIKRIEQLEQGHTILGIDAIEQHSAEVDDIASQLDALAALAIQAGDAFSRKVKKKLQSLFLRLKFLPQVPRIEVVRLAQNVLAQKPLVLVTDDIVNEETGRPELTGIVLMELTEVPRFEYHFAPCWHGNVHILELNTIGKATNTTTPPTSLEVAWSELQSSIDGRYIVAFDLLLAQIQFDVTARTHGLAVPMLVGHSLLDLLLLYVGVKEPISYEIGGPRLSLADAQLCDLMAREDVAPFYDSSLAPADQRAQHLLHTLQKMADGTLSLQEPRHVPPMKPRDPFSEQKG